MVICVIILTLNIFWGFFKFAWGNCTISIIKMSIFMFKGKTIALIEKRDRLAIFISDMSVKMSLTSETSLGLISRSKFEFLASDHNQIRHPTHR
jgi:hypothetical protein